MENTKDALQTLLEGANGKDIELVDVGKEESEKLYFVDPILLNEESIDGLMNSNEFTEGLKIGAKYAGVYTAMINAGAEVSFAQDITFNVQMEDIAKSTGKINKEIADVTSKNTALVSEKNQL